MPLPVSECVSYSRQVIRVIRTTEFETWIRALKDRRGRLRIVQRIDRLAGGNPGDVRSVGKGVSELRVDAGPGYRVYFARDGSELILLLCGGDKSTQKADIERARRLAEKWRVDRQEDGHDGRA